MPVGPLRFFHVNVNCSDLEQSLAFYRDLVGLQTTVRTRPERPQPGGAFGLDEVQWDAWIMAGDDASDGVVLDLLEWQVPLPSGSPPASVFELGFGRLCILTDDLAGLHRRLSEAGYDVWSPPARVNLGAEGLAAPELFLCSDPDGTAVQFVQARQHSLGPCQRELLRPGSIQALLLRCARAERPHPLLPVRASARRGVPGRRRCGLGRLVHRCPQCQSIRVHPGLGGVDPASGHRLCSTEGQ